MIDLEKRALQALAKCSMRMASSGKRFRNDMVSRLEHEPSYKLTEAQALYLWFIVDMYRRQIADAELKRIGAERKITGRMPEGVYLEGDLRPTPEKPIRQYREGEPLPLICESRVTHEPCGGKKIIRCALERGHEGQHTSACMKHHLCMVQW